jgi:4a-hydroxytetrahydrobiopterin dehydratase
MDKATALDETQIASLLSEMPHWSVVEGALRRELRFENFSQAFGFMTRVALAAETLGHHPDWSNSWNHVTISILHHDVGRLSSMDAKLAREVERIRAESGHPEVTAKPSSATS